MSKSGIILVLLLVIPFMISIHDIPSESNHTHEEEEHNHAGSDVILLEDFYNIGSLLMQKDIGVDAGMLTTPVLDGHEGLYNIERAIKNCYASNINCPQAQEGLQKIAEEIEHMKEEPSH